MPNLNMFLKYKQYFETWLNIPVENMEQSQGVFLSSSEKRKHKPDGWLIYLPVCAFETKNAMFISCIPEWEDELRCLLRDTSASEAIPKIKNFATEKALYCAHHKFYSLNTLNSLIDTTQAVPLDYAHHEKYAAFYRKVHPSLCNFVNPDDWIAKDFKEIVDKKIHYCVFVDNEIVSATDSENIPNKPDKIIQIGINTLQNHRRKGYASIACAAFIKNHLEQGLLPMWYCDINNKESEMLAIKLGFCHAGNEIYVSSLVEI